jgi:hypothetical protein
VWGRTAIVRWGDGLAAVDLTSRAVELDGWVEPLVHEDGNTFRRLRADDGSRGEGWLFTVDAEGRATGVIVHSTPMQRVR